MLQANKLVALCGRNKHGSGTDHGVEFNHISHSQVGFVRAKLHVTFLVFTITLTSSFLDVTSSWLHELTYILA